MKNFLYSWVFPFAILTTGIVFVIAFARQLQLPIHGDASGHHYFKFPDDPFDQEYNPYKTKDKHRQGIWLKMSKQQREEYCDYLMILWLESQLARAQKTTGDDECD